MSVCGSTFDIMDAVSELTSLTCLQCLVLKVGLFYTERRRKEKQKRIRREEKMV